MAYLLTQNTEQQNLSGYPGDAVINPATDSATQNTTIDVSGQDVTNYIDGYCERNHKPEAMAEPLNLFTNIGFIIGAVMAYAALRAFGMNNKRNWDIIVLIILLAIIGIGSSMFHAFPSGHTVLMDVIPIGIFMHFYLLVFFYRVAGLNLFLSVGVLVIFIATGIIFQKTFSPDTLNGTIMYVPAYTFLLIMVFILCFIKQSPLYLHLINTAVIWTFSLAFRTVDMQLCNYTHHLGTHFLWHLLNAIVLYKLVVLVIIDKKSKKSIAMAEQVPEIRG